MKTFVSKYGSYRWRSVQFYDGTAVVEDAATIAAMEKDPFFGVDFHTGELPRLRKPASPDSPANARPEAGGKKSR